MYISLPWAFLAISMVHARIGQRDANSITASLTTISNQLVAMNSTLNQFQGGFNGTLLALQIQGEASTLLGDINDATTVTQQSAMLDDADSATVAFSVVSLSSNIYDLLDNLVRKKAAFDTAILGIASASFLVESDLVELKNGTDAFAQALSSKFDAAIKNVAPLVVADIDFHFSQAITVYAS